MEKVRTQKWDILKFFLIFLVVLGHLCDFYTGKSEIVRSIFLFIYLFHMPLFFFISGLFSKRNVNEKRWNKICSYLILCFFTKFLYFLYFSLFGGNYHFQLFTEIGLPWFMFALFVFSVLTIALRQFSPIYTLAIWVLFACMIGYDSSVGDFLALSRIIVYFPFFYLGYCLDAKKLEAHGHHSGRKIVAAVLLVSIAAAIFLLCDQIYHPLRLLATGRNPYIKLRETLAPFGFFLRLGMYALTCIMSYAIMILTPNYFPIVAKWGECTLAVYCFHNVILKILFNNLGATAIFMALFPSCWPIMLIPTALLLTILLSNQRLTKALSQISAIPLRKMPQTP